MDDNERQVIDELFEKIRLVEERSGGRDGDAEARIRDHIGRQPAAPYYMAQTILVQQQALAAAEARIDDLERQVSERASGSFLSGLFGGTSRPALVLRLGSARRRLCGSASPPGRRLSRRRRADGGGRCRRRPSRQRARRAVR